MNEKSIILDCQFDRLTTSQVLTQIESFISAGDVGYLCTVNVSILMMMRENPTLRSIVNRANWIVADGMPLIWASRFFKPALPERVTGVEMVTPLARMAAKRGWGIYFLGGSQQVVKAVVEKMTNEVPNITISGYSDGYFSNQEAAARAEAIKRSGAKILIVAMGVPRQEIFIDQFNSDSGASFSVGVGGSFDVIAGFTKRAPVWMQNSGLEWLYRTIQEPRRLLGRYLKTNSQFLILISIAGFHAILKKLRF